MQSVVIGTPTCAKKPRSYLDAILAAQSGQDYRKRRKERRTLALTSMPTST